MIGILEFVTIISYLFSDILGFCISTIMFLTIWLSKKHKVFNIIMLSLILSVPIFQISFLGEKMHHLFSWFMIFLIILILYMINNFIKKEIRFSKLPLLFVSIAISIIIINNLLSKYYKENLVELVQILLMVFPILMIYQQKDFLIENINKEEQQLWIKYINITLIATAIATVIQYFLHTNLGIWI